MLCGLYAPLFVTKLRIFASSCPAETTDIRAKQKAIVTILKSIFLFEGSWFFRHCFKVSTTRLKIILLNWFPSQNRSYNMKVTQKKRLLVSRELQKYTGVGRQKTYYVLPIQICYSAPMIKNIAFNGEISPFNSGITLEGLVLLGVGPRQLGLILYIFRLKHLFRTNSARGKCCWIVAQDPIFVMLQVDD